MNKNVFGLIALSVLSVVTGHIFIKKGVETLGGLELTAIIPFFINALTNIHVLIGGTLFVISAALWLLVLNKAELSASYPALSLSYVLAAIAGWLLFNETLGTMRVGGIMLVCIGVFALSRS